jgi:DNA adenine methylase
MMADSFDFDATPPLPIVLKPPLKWAGGKRWLVPRLVEIWQSFPISSRTRLVEPFVGGLSVSLGLQPQQALLNDINPHLINLYHHLQQGLEIALEMVNDADVYYQQRSRFNQLIGEGLSHTSEGAQLFYYLNRTGFNGLCRFNNQGQYNVPFGRNKTINYLQDFTAYKQMFANWQFTCGDFANLSLNSTDLIYADPPYDDGFTKYSQDDFTWTDRVRLVEWLARHSGVVILSDRATDRVVNLCQEYEFKIYPIEAPRRIACNGDRRPAQEIIAVRGVECPLK